MRAGDLDEVLAIERVSFSMPWSRGAFLYEIEQNRVARCQVARQDGRLVAYLCLWDVADEIHITNIAVHPECRRRGIARALLSAMIEQAQSQDRQVVVLEVRPTNQEAIGLYESLGFQVVGRRKGYYYDTGEDALVMEARLKSAPSSRGNRRTG